MLLKLTEKWLSKLKDGLLVGIILIDFSKALIAFAIKLS